MKGGTFCTCCTTSDAPANSKTTCNSYTEKLSKIDPFCFFDTESLISLFKNFVQVCLFPRIKTDLWKLTYVKLGGYLINVEEEGGM